MKDKEVVYNHMIHFVLDKEFIVAMPNGNESQSDTSQLFRYLIYRKYKFIANVKGSLHFRLSSNSN